MDVVTGRVNERGRMAVPERVHLLSADDTVTDCYRYGTYLALCGALVAADSLPESLHPDDCECDTERLYCPECVRAAARCGADAGLVDLSLSDPVSAAEGHNGSGPSTESPDLAVMRASLRCGRSLPVLHLTDSGEAFTQRRRQRDVIVLCCADVAEPDPDVEDLCPGCRDCERYCPDCVREANRFSAGLPDPVPAAPGGGPDPAP